MHDTSSDADQIAQILAFWFTELPPSAWFRKDPAVDQQIITRFGSIYEHWHRHVPAPVDARASLATVIVLDQFPRNMFRGSARAFASDVQALTLSQRAIALGHDQQLPPHERQFIYMPFQHSEDLRVQIRSLELFAQLGLAMQLDYAHQHEQIIRRFGRFPHRNALLGRASTGEEQEFLRDHPGF